MGKLFNLKEWLTVPETAGHLSIIYGEDVTEADVLRLALDGHLKLSVHLVNGAYASPCVKVDLAEIEWDEIPGIKGGNPLKIPRNGRIWHDKNGTFQVLSLVTELDSGIWDLPMVGGERLDVEHLYQQLTEGPKVSTVSLDGVFVASTNGGLQELKNSLEDNKFQSGSVENLTELKRFFAKNNIGKKMQKNMFSDYEDDRKKYLEQQRTRESDDFYPAGSLPNDCVFVVRTRELRNIEIKLNDISKKPDKPLETTERNTLLTIIAALCDYSAIDHQKSGAASQIEKLTLDIGAAVTDDTIRKVLKKIPEALRTRMK
jgi:hypothetical protein